MRFLQYFTGPTIFRHFTESRWVIYEPNFVEALTGSAIGWAESLMSTYLLLIPWYLAYQPFSHGFNKSKSLRTTLFYNRLKALSSDTFPSEQLMPNTLVSARPLGLFAPLFVALEERRIKSTASTSTHWKNHHRSQRNKNMNSSKSGIFPSDTGWWILKRKKIKI